MSRVRIKLSPRLRDAIDHAGMPWHIKPPRGGGTHAKLCIGGRFIGIVPMAGGADTGRAEKNLLSQIRRAARSENAGRPTSASEGSGA